MFALTRTLSNHGLSCFIWKERWRRIEDAGAKIERELSGLAGAIPCESMSQFIKLFQLLYAEGLKSHWIKYSLLPEKLTPQYRST